jgi:hypothetical protein
MTSGFLARAPWPIDLSGAVGACAFRDGAFCGGRATRMPPKLRQLGRTDDALPMNARLRLAATCLVLAAVSGALAGCGGSGTSRGAANVGANQPITKAQATAYARAVNLRAGDLPLGSVFKAEGESREHRHSRLEACERGASDSSPMHPIIHRKSATLGWNLPDEFERISSSVEVLPSAALMARHNAVNRSRRMLNCAKRYFPQLLGEKNAGSTEIGPVTVSRLPDPLPGIAGAYEYRIGTTVIVGRSAPVEPVDYMPEQIRRVPLHIDGFGFTAGRAEINLIALGAPRPVSRNVEDQLLVLLYSRTKEPSIN